MNLQSIRRFFGKTVKAPLAASVLGLLAFAAQAADVPRNFTVTSGDAVTGTVALTKTGAGILSLINYESNTFSGDITVEVDAGTLKVGGALGAVGANQLGVTLTNMVSTNTITVKRGGIFYVEDNAIGAIAGYATNRFGVDGSRPGLRLAGGTFYYNGANVASLVMTQTLGTLTLDPGPSALTIVRTTGGTPQLILTNLVQNRGSYLTLTGIGLGTAAVNVPQILLGVTNSVGGGGAPGSRTMSIMPGARLGSDLVYSGTNGLRALVTGEYNEVAGNDVNTALTNENVKILFAAPAAFPSLTAPRTLNSLVITNTAASTWLLNNVLTLTSGQLLSTPATAKDFRNGSLTAGSGGPVDLDITAIGPLTIASTITDNGTGVVTLVKNGAGTLTLTNNAADNTYSGGTVINEGGVTLVLATNIHFLGSGKVTVDNSVLTMFGIGATANSTGDDYTAVNGGQIAIGNVPHTADDTFNIGPLSILSGATGTGTGLNSLDRGIGGESAVTNIVLATDAIIGQPALTLPLNATNGSIKNLGTSADLYYGLGGAQASALGSLTIGANTPFKGVSTLRAAVAWTLGTINVASGTSDIYFQGLAAPGVAPVLLTIGNLAVAGGAVVNLADAGTVNANVLGAVAVDDDAAVFGDTGKTLNFKVNPGATLTFNQPAGMGSGTGIATAQVLEGGTLAAANPAAFNGAATVEAGGRLLANQVGLSGTGALMFNTGSILDIFTVYGFSGPQARAATINPGTIVRMSIVGVGSPADTLNSYLADKSPIYEVYNSLGWPINPAVRSTIMTLNKDAATGLGGMLVNDSLTRAVAAVPNGVVVVGPNGGTIAATTNTTLTIPQAIDLGANALTIGATNRIDGVLLPKLGTVLLTAAYGFNTALPGSSITVVPGAILGNSTTLNALPEAADITVNGTLLLGAAQSIGSLSGTGMVSLAANPLTVGRNNQSTTFSGSMAGSGAILKTGAGRLDLTTYVTNTSLITVNGGTLALSGNGQTTNTGATAYTLIGDGTLALDNSSVNMTNRLAGAAPGVTFQGGTFRFAGKDGEGSSELLGAAAFNSGASTIDIINGSGAGSTAQVTFSAGASVAGTVNFTSSNGTLGMTGENPRVLFASGVATGLVPYATVGSVPAYYETATGIRAYTLDESTEFDGTAVQTLLNTKYSSTNNHLALTALRTVNSLWIDSPGNGFAVDLGAAGASNLNVTLGRILLTGTNDFEFRRSGTSIATLGSTSNGKMYFGVDNAAASLTISVPVTNGTGTVDKDGAGTLVLNATNTFTTGGLTINAGTVKYGPNGDLASTAPITTWGSGVLDFNGKTDGVAAVTLYAGGITNTGSGGFLTVASLTMGSGPVGSSAFVNSGSGSIKLGGAVAYNAVNDPDKSVIAGTLDLNGATRTFTVANSLGTGAVVDLDIPAVITGATSNGIVKAGLGTMKLGGSNTFDGPLSIGNTLGTVILANPQAMGVPGFFRTNSIGTSDTLALDNAGTISDPNNRITLSLNGVGDPLLGAVSGALANLAGNNTVPCAILLAATGTQIASLKAGDKLTLTGNIGGAAMGLVVVGEGDTDLGGALANTTGTLTKNGGGTLTLNGTNANTFTGTTTLNGGKLVLDKATGVAITSGVITINNGAVLQYAASSTNPNLIGTAGLIINGAGQLDFNGATDLIGAITNAVLGATADTLGILNTAGGGNLTIGNLTLAPVAGYTHRIDSGSGIITLGSNVVVTASTPGTGRTRISGNLALGNATRIFTVGAGTGPDYDLDIDAVISGGAGAGLSNVTGRLRLSNTNTYSGDTTLTSGTLKYGVSNAIPSGPGYGNVILTAGTLELNGFSPTINGLSGAGTIDNNVAGPLTNTLTVGANDQSSIYSGVLKNTTGTVALVKTGAGMLTLSAANIYSGDTLISTGRVKYGIVTAIPSAAGKGNVTVNGTLDLGGFSPTVNGLYGSGIIDNGTGAAAYTLTIGANNQNGFFSGMITNTTGVVAVTKSGSGSLILSGANSYSGLTTVAAGTLNIQNGNALGWTNLGVSVTAGATLELEGGIEIPAEAMTLNSTGMLNNGALRNVSGTNVYGGLVTLATISKIQSESGLLRLSHPGVMSGAFALTVAGAGDVTIDSVLGIAAGTLTKVDAGTLTLTGSNTFSGLTTVNGGRLVVANAAGSGTGSGAVNVNVGVFGGTGLASALVTISNGAALAPGLDGTAGGILTVGRLTLQAGSTLAFECSATPTNDSAMVTNVNGLTLSGGGIYLFEEGTTNAWTAPGTYNLIKYAGSIAGSVTNLTVMNPVAGRSYNVGLSGGWVVLAVGSTVDSVWNGASPDDSNWLTPLNWVSGTAPDPNAVLVFSGTSRLNASNNFDEGTWFRSLLFDPAAGAFVFDGNGIKLADSIFNDSAQTQTINLPLTLALGSRTMGGAGDVVLNGAINDGGQTNGLYKTGIGTLTLGASNSFFGPVVISNGAVVAQNSFALGLPTNGIMVAGGASLQLMGGISIPGTKPLVLGGTGTNDDGALRNLQDFNTYAAPITLTAPAKIASDSGTLVLDVAAGSGIVGTQDLTFGGAGNILVMDPIATSSGRVTKTGSGALSLQAANTFIGGAQLDDGTLNLNIATALNTNVLTINGGALGTTVAGLIIANRSEWNGDFAYNGSQNLTLSGAALMSTDRIVTVNSSSNLIVTGLIGPTNEYGLTKAGIGILTLSNTNQFAGLTRVEAGTLRYGINNALSTGPLAVNGGIFDLVTFTDTVGTVTMSNGNILATTGILNSMAGFTFENGLVTAILAGTGSVTKTTSGFVTMSGANTFTGSVNLMEGTLRATNSLAALGVGLSTLNLWGGELQLANNVPLAFARPTTLYGDMRILSDRVTAGGGVTNSLGSLSLGAVTLTVAPGDNVVSGAAGILFGAVAMGGDPVFNVLTNGADAGMVLSLGALNEGGVPRTIRKTGPGMLILSASASGLGINTRLNVAEGRVHAAFTNALGAMAFVDLASGTVFSLGADEILGSLSNTNDLDSSAQVWLGGKTLTLGNNSVPASFSGVIMGTGLVSKIGGEKMVLSGTNTFSGLTTVYSGNLNIQHPSALGSTNAGTTVVNLGALEIEGSFETYAEPLTLNGTGIGNSGALRNMSGDAIYGGLLTLGSASLIQSDIGTLTLSHPGVISGAYALTVGGSGHVAINSVLGMGAGKLIKVDAGTLTLTAANTFTGGTTINAGKVSLFNASGSGTGSGAVTVNNEATLTGVGSVAGVVTNQSGGVIAPGSDGTAGGQLTFGRLVLQPGSKTIVELNLSLNDVIVVTNAGGLTLNGGDVYLKDETTGGSWGTNGTYNLIQYSGSLVGSADSLTIANPAPGKKYTFRALDGWVKVIVGGADAVWNGASLTDANWTTGANWLSGAAPEPLASLTFDGTQRTDNTNDYPVDTGFNALAFDASADPFVLNGNRLRLLGSVINNSLNPQTLTLPVTLSLGTRTWNTVSNDITVAGAIDDGTETNGLIKTGLNVLALAGDNTYKGLTVVSNGAVLVSHPNALGSSVTGTVVKANTGLWLNTDAASVLEPLNLSGTGVTNSGALRSLGNSSAGGPITLADHTRLMADAGTLTLNSATPVAGAFQLTLGGAGDIVMDGLLGSALQLVNKVGSGTLYLNSTNLFNATLYMYGGRIVHGTDNALAKPSLVYLTNGDGGPALWDLGSYTDDVGQVTLYSGRVTGSGSLSSPKVTVSGPAPYTGALRPYTNYWDIELTGTGTLYSTGSGNYNIISSTNTYTGLTYISSGSILDVNNLADGGLPSGIGASSSDENNLKLGGQLWYSGPSASTDRGMVVAPGCRIYSYNAWWQRTDQDEGTIAVTRPEAVLTLNGVVNSITNFGAANAIPGSFFYKAGLGTLELANTNRYVGRTVVQEGTLRVSGSIANSNWYWTTVYPLIVQSNAFLSGAGWVKPDVQINALGRIAPGKDLTAGTALTVGRLTLADDSEAAFQFSPDGTTNDSVSIVSRDGLTLGQSKVFLYEEGTTNAWTTNGTFQLIHFEGTIVGGGAALLTMGNPVSGLGYSFKETNGWVCVTITGGARWDGGGSDDNWMTAGNWESDVAPVDGDVLTFTGYQRTMNLNDYPSGTKFSGMIFDAGADIFTLEGNSLTLAGNLLNQSSNLQVLSQSMTLEGGDQIIGTLGGDLTLYGTIEDAGSGLGIIKTGPKTLSLAANNTYGGTTEIRMGTLKLETAEAIPHGAGKGLLLFTSADVILAQAGYAAPGLNSTIAGDSVLDLAGYSETVNGIAGSGVITNSGGATTLTLEVSQSVTSSVSIAGGANLALVKRGTGMQVLAAASSYSGGTTVEEGELRLANTIGSAIGAGDATVAASAVLSGTGAARGGTLTLAGGSLVEPGQDGIGSLTVNNLAWADGAELHLEVTNLIGSANDSYDNLLVLGTLAPATSGDKLIIRLDSNGQLLSVPSQTVSLRLITFPNGTVDQSDYTLDTNSFLTDGSWALTNIGHSLYAQCEGVYSVATWIGSGLWSDPTNWSGGIVPQVGDTVVFDETSVANCTAGLNTVPELLGSLSLASGYTGRVLFEKRAVAAAESLVLSGDLTIGVGGGSLVLEGNPDEIGGGTVDNPWGQGYSISAQNITVAAGANLNADNRGFAPMTGPGKAKGTFTNAGGEYTPMIGASHGGYGGAISGYDFTISPNSRYGSVHGPTELGSGGFRSTGGGALKLQASGTITINGTLSASCTNMWGTGGSGGSVWIAGGTLEGFGSILATGATVTNGVAGGGGRIDISGAVNNFQGLLDAQGGVGKVPSLLYPTIRYGWAGSIALPASGGTGLNLASFTPYTNIVFGNALTCNVAVITSNVTVRMQAYENETEFVCNSLTVHSNGNLVGLGDYWALNPADGGSVADQHGLGVTIAAADIDIQAGGSINADVAGFQSAKGFTMAGLRMPFSGPGGSGAENAGEYQAASHGGQGGVGHTRATDVSRRRPMYGSAVGPTALGSGGEGEGYIGGGALKLVVGNTITVDGRVSADAAPLAVGAYGGPAGGSIWMTGGGTLQGSGRISANATMPIATSGGGGRIDISGTVNNFTGVIQAEGGKAYNYTSKRGLTGSIMLPASAGSSGAVMDNFIPYGTNFAFGNSVTFSNCVVTNGVILTLDANEGSNVFTFGSLTVESGGEVRCLGNVAASNVVSGGSHTRILGEGVTIVASNVDIQAGGLLTANGNGMTACIISNNVGLNAYGGYGGGYSGVPYGELTNVTVLGSGVSAAGGGAIRLVVAGTLNVEGIISSDGAATAITNGGSGGSVWITCGSLQGAGMISANGSGATNRIGGGGGRIHLAYNTLASPNPLDNGIVSAFGGASNIATKGAGGTIFVQDLGAGDLLGTLITGNNLPATNAITPLLNQDMAFSRIQVRENGALMVMPQRTLTLSAGLSNAATFYAAPESIVAFTGTTDKVVYGGNSYFDTLVITGETQTVRFGPGTTNTIVRSLVLDNANLLSTEQNQWWYMNVLPGSTQDVRRVTVRDSNARPGLTVYVTDRASHNEGNNPNWRFPPNGVIMMIR